MHKFTHKFLAILMTMLTFTSPVFSAAEGTYAPDRDWSFQIGGGYTPPVGGMDAQLTDGWNFTMGTAYQMTETTGLLFEYGSYHLGLEQGVLNHYSDLINAATDGHARVWSLTINPKKQFQFNHILGGYLIGGGGYYHVNAEVTTPGLAYIPPYCDPWWGCWGGGFTDADYVVAQRKDDTGGVNAGFGLTFDLSPMTQLFMETRYHHILTDGPDLQILPFTAGLRF